MGWIEFQDRYMKARVNGDLPRARRTVFAIIPKFFLAVTATGIYTLAPTPYSTAAVLFICLVMGLWPMQGLARQQVYTRGWRDGRTVAFNALAEANRRGMDLDTWIDAEQERTMRTIL